MLGLRDGAMVSRMSCASGAAMAAHTPDAGTGSLRTPSWMRATGCRTRSDRSPAALLCSLHPNCHHSYVEFTYIDGHRSRWWRLVD